MPKGEGAVTDVIHIRQVTKLFKARRKSVRAVDQLSLRVSRGLVFGFLGPNGAGKSTTIRMMLDLVRPTEGQIELFGKAVRGGAPGLKKTGALVEGAAFYPFLSGRENLQVLSRTGPAGSSGHVDSLLEKVGLSKRAGQRVSEYSTGMKQRLGIAAALLGDPELVILDEPTNGLDPGGMIEIRGFIRSLADEQGKTVFLSSHLLNEVEQICDRVAIIHQGKLLREGSVDELLQREVALFQLQVSQPEQACDLLQQNGSGAELDRPGWIRLEVEGSESGKIVRLLVENGVEVRQAVLARQSLEDFFITVTGPEED